jgi:hypothetical protein
MTPASPAIATVQAVIVAAAALCFGRLVVEAIVGCRELDRLVRWALAFPGLLLFTFGMMLVHIVTGGAIFSHAWVTRGVTVATAASLIVWVARARRDARHGEPLPRWQMWTVAGACLLGAVVWGAPIARALPLNFVPDTNLHMGWATQLMAGESTPSTVVTGNVPGSYPWLYHALTALLARFTPGGRAFDALGPLQLLQVVGAILALFGLGKEMTGRFITGAAAAFFGALCGGFGIGMLFNPRLRAQAPDLRATQIPWLGDVLSRRPYNFAFNDIAPPYPRDLSFALLVAALLLLVMGLRRKSFPSLIAAGVVLGLTGLSGGEAVIVGIAAATSVCLVQREVQPLRAALAVLVPLSVVWGTWLVPLMVNYFKFGGFVNTTHIRPVVVPFLYLVLSWGLATPFALVGIVASLRRLREPGVLVPLAMVLITAVIMASNLITTAFGSSFSTLGRDSRYWVLCQLGAALLAALGATALLDRIESHPAVAKGSAVLILVLGIASPALGSDIYPRKHPPDTLIHASLEGRATLLNAMAPSVGHRCVAAALGNRLAREVFAYTGYRMVQWQNYPGRPNDARIRWRDIYRRIPGDRRRSLDNRILTTGVDSVQRWRAVARRYHVNLVVVPEARAGSPAFADLPKERFALYTAPVTLVRVTAC